MTSRSEIPRAAPHHDIEMLSLEDFEYVPYFIHVV